jgi:ribonuclease BN (tRNA processing enzyme)
MVFRSDGDPTREPGGHLQGGALPAGDPVTGSASGEDLTLVGRTYTRRVRLTVLGSNGTYPTPGHPASGYLVEGGGSAVWTDAGPGTLSALHAFVDPVEIDALVLTHVHGDHCLDVFPLFNLLRFGRRPRTPLPVYAPDGVAERLAAFIDVDPGHDFFRVFDFVTVAPGDGAAVGDLALSFGEAVHPVPALSVRVAAGRASLAYSGDTGPGGGLVDLANGVDVLLCEATKQGARPPDGYPYHMYAGEAGAVAQRAGVSRLLVTHVTPTLDPAVSVQEAAAVFEGPVDWAAPGMEVEL